jgi:hypothetical protein
MDRHFWIVPKVFSLKQMLLRIFLVKAETIFFQVVGADHNFTYVCDGMRQGA